MAKRGKRTIINAKVGFILNEWFGESLPGLLDGFDVATGFTATAGEIAGEWDGLKGNVLESTSSEPKNMHISLLNNNQWKREIN